MNKITTNGNSVTFERENGHIDVVEKGQYYIHINSDTVNFILIPRTDRGGVALFSSTMSNLTVEGKTYSEDEWKDGTATSDLSANDGLSYKVVDELPETGDKGVVYLVKAEEEEENNKYIEYIYVDDAYEVLGSFNTDIDLTQFYTKEESDEKYATKEEIPSTDNLATKQELAGETSEREKQDSALGGMIAGETEAREQAITNLTATVQGKLDTKLNVADTLSEEEINEIMK